jgi:hypothetical protein
VSELDQIVQIQINRETTAIATASFQIPLVLASFTNFAERTRIYTDFDSVADDFDSTDNVYKIASNLFGQDGVRPPYIIVGRRQVDSVTFTPTVANNTVYSITINGTTYSITSSNSATATNIISALDTEIGDVAGITLSGTTSLTVAPSVAGSPWSVTSSSNLVGVNAQPTETWVEALDTVSDVNNQWYALIAETHVQADVLALAAAIQPRHKIYITSTQDPAVVTTATTDVASLLKAGGYSRTAIIYLPTADTQYPEAAWVGSQLPRTPGSNDWDFKKANGITVSSLTDTQRTNLRAKNANMYTTVAGVAIFQDGNMSTGVSDAIDIIIGIDWTYARMQEAIYSRLVNLLKVPYTRNGFLIIESEMRSVLSQGEANGLYDSGWNVISPDPLTIAASQRIQRIAGDFTFTARLQGSVRVVTIVGTVTA